MHLQFGNLKHIDLKQKSIFGFLVESADDLERDAIEAERKQLESLIAKMRRGEVLNGPEQKAYQALTKKFVDTASAEFGNRVTTYQEIADHFDVHVQTVKNWAKRGMPINGRNNYDLAVIRKWAIGQGLIVDHPAEKGEEGIGGQTENYSEKLQRERYLHERAKREERELKVKEAIGSLVRVEDVGKEFKAMAQAIKMDILALPHKIAPFLEGLSAVEIQKKLEIAVDDILRHLSQEVHNA